MKFPPLPAIPAPFGIPWPVIGIAVVVLCVVGVFHFFEQSIRADERRIAAVQVAAVQAQAAAEVREEAEKFRNRTRSLDRSLAAGREALESVPHDASAENFLVVWARADRGLYDGAPG